MIQLNSIRKSYNKRVILDNINLTIKSGEITFIVGTSGAGKTTMLNIMGGLDKPDSGSVLFNEKDIWDDINTYRANNIGFVFQDYNLLQGLTVVQNVEIATELSGLKKSADEIISDVKALGVVDPDQRVETLSGGEKQRVAIIRSMCKDVDIIIADEPTGSLDSNNADLVLDMLRGIKENKHIIIVSHDMEKARKYADRIITISDGNIVNDERMTKSDKELAIEEKKECNLKRENPNIRHMIWMLGKNSVRMHLGRVISIALVIALSIASLATVIDINTMGNKLSHNVNVNYLENDLMQLYYENTPNAGQFEYPFTEEDISAVQDEFNIKEMVKIYIPSSKDWFFTAETGMCDACLKQINVNGFFKERVLSNDIEGGFISGDDEVIISEKIAEELFSGDCIGKKIILNSGDGGSREYTIVGINHTKNPSDKIYSFVSADSIKVVLEDSLEQNLFVRQELGNFYTQIQSMITGGLYGSMAAVDNEEELVLGEFPAAEGEILISSELLACAISEFGIESSYTKDEIASGEMKQGDIDRIFAKEFALNYNGVFSLHISGVYSSEDIEMRFSPELIEKMKIVDPVGIELYAQNPEEINEIKEKIIKKYDFTANVQLDTLKSNISGQTMFFSAALVLLGVVLVCISCALLSSFSRMAVLERKKEMAIVKSLGASDRSVLGVLLFDSSVISIMAFLMSFVFYGALKLAQGFVLTNENLMSGGVPVVLLLLISVIFAVLIFVQTGITLRRVVKKMPADLIRE